MAARKPWRAVIRPGPRTVALRRRDHPPVIFFGDEGGTGFDARDLLELFQLLAREPQDPEDPEDPEDL